MPWPLIASQEHPRVLSLAGSTHLAGGLQPSKRLSCLFVSRHPSMGGKVIFQVLLEVIHED